MTDMKPHRQSWTQCLDLRERTQRLPPLEQHVGTHRWILIAQNEDHVLYWCAHTGRLKDGEREFTREDLWDYFGYAVWWGEDSDRVYDLVAKLPLTPLGRWLWKMKHPVEGETA